MTTTEFSHEFDILYNSIASNFAPGIDEYEKSVYLTKAQLEIVKNYYDAFSNRKQKGFESSEKRREDLKELIRTHVDNDGFDNDNPITLDGNSKLFTLPDDLMFIIVEQAEISSSDCYNGALLPIKAVTHDEFITQYDNPFKQPSYDVVWRIDFSKTLKPSSTVKKVVELISPYCNSVQGNSVIYRMRYLKYPTPIILTDLDSGLTIDGIDVETDCELNEHLHREILDRAVELALRDYRPEGLESKISLDQRNE